MILGEEWLQRRTRQSWWAIDQLVRAVMYAALTGLLAYVGHPLLALAIAALAAFEIVLARRSWVKPGSRDLLERYRMELENPSAASRDSGRGSPGLGVRGWIFVFGTVGVWSLFEHWGLSWVSAGVVVSVIALLVLRLTRRRSPDRPLRWNSEEFEPWVAGDEEGITRSVGRDHDQRPDGVPSEHEFHFTVTGRTGRLLGRLLERLVSPSNTRNE